MSDPRPAVFISYCHADEVWKERLVKHLTAIADEAGFEVWDDRRIGAGADWKAEIERALRSASVAVLLVSVDFLTSRFIKGEEVPPLLRRRAEERLPLIPVIVGSCAWRRASWLAGMQARPKDGRPLDSMSRPEADQALAHIAEEIADRIEEVRVEGPAAPPPPPQPPRPQPPDRAARHTGWRRVALIGLTVSIPVVYVATRAGSRVADPTPAPEASLLAPPSPAPETPVPVSEPPAVPAPAGVTLQPFSFEKVRVDQRGEIVARHTRSAPSFEEDLGGGVTLRMVEIPAGTFTMGSPDNEAGRATDEGPPRQVTVASFWMGAYEVTQAQWRAVAKGLPRVSRDLEADPSGFKGAQLPVETVSWHDAVEFCARLTRHTGRQYRLPSEAEWEYAARAGTTTPFHFGATITPTLVNYNGNFPYGQAPKGPYREKTTPAGSLGVANAFGLFDIHGNVWEWVEDVWHDSFSGAPVDGRAWNEGGNPSGRVLRGGSWLNGARNCRAAYRLRDDPENWLNLWGFRVVCSVSRTQ